MKKLLFALFMIGLSACAFAQGAPQITIKNNTACIAHFVLRIDDAASPCVVRDESNTLAIAPFTSVTYTNTTCPGVATGMQNFISARVLFGEIACSLVNPVFGSANPSDPCYNSTPAVMMTYLNPVTASPSCGTCSTGIAIWDTSNYPTEAMLIFN